MYMEKKLYQTKLKIEQELSIEINNPKDLSIYYKVN